MAAIRYTESHEWLLEEGGVITMGITDHAQSLLGAVVYVELPQLDQKFEVGDELVIIESVKAAGSIEVPVAGQVVAINELLVDAPEIVNDDPMNGGWMVKFKIQEPFPEELFMTENQYRQSIED